MEFTPSEFAVFLTKKVDRFASGMTRSVAKELLKATTANPGPPVDTGKLKRSGTAYAGSEEVANNGKEPVRYYTLPVSPYTATVVYSAIKPASDTANKYFTFAGTRWFDYAEKQHREHAHHAFWVRNTMTGASLARILRKARIQAV